MRRTLRKWLGSPGVQKALNASVRLMLANLGLGNRVAGLKSHAVRTLLVPRHMHLPLGKTNTYIRNGIQWLLDPGEYHQWKVWSGSPEPVLAPLQQWVDKTRPTLLLDIGANIGQISLPMAQWAYQSGLSPERLDIWAFEPHPVIRGCLEANLAANRHLQPYIQVQPVAVGDTTGTVHLHSPNPRHMGLTHVGTVGPAGAPAAPVVRLDDLLPTDATTGKHILVKMDVEGFELAALRGTQQLLQRHHPTLLLEVGDAGLRRAGTSAWELITWLKSVGYTHFTAVPEGTDTSAWQEAAWQDVFLNLLVRSQ